MRVGREDVAVVVLAARELIAAHERRDPRTEFVTESERMALAHLSYAMSVRAREHEATHGR